MTMWASSTSGCLAGLAMERELGRLRPNFLMYSRDWPEQYGPVDEPEIVKVQVPAHVGVADLLGKDVEQGVLLLDALRQGQVGGLGAVRDVGVFPVGMEDELVHVVEGNPQAGVHLAGFFQAVLDELRIHQLPDQGSRDQGDLGPRRICSSTSRLIRSARVAVDRRLAQRASTIRCRFQSESISLEVRTKSAMSVVSFKLLFSSLSQRASTTVPMGPLPLCS